MTRFLVEFAEAGSGERRRTDVTELMAVRIRNFGGVLQELAPGASLGRDDLRLVFCHTASRLAYVLYVARGLLRRNWKIRGIELAYTGRVSCKYLDDSASVSRASDAETKAAEAKIYVETDGELVGTLPAEITVAPDALTLLAPDK